MHTLDDVARLVQAGNREVSQLHAAVAAMAADLAALKAAAQRERAPVTGRARRRSRNAARDAIDAEVASQLVPLIFSRLGDGPFEAGEIIDRAAAGDPQIALALRPLIEGCGRQAAAQRLGHLLQRQVEGGRSFSGYTLRLVREATSNDPQLFAVEPVSDPARNP